ncbi:hypothetical protein [Bdellovibrio sp. BCCA]|uniref:hypothetical protein n=1 Tax=Bdellovibrio sp. BCCA TaxID=3136281 RepID=UPI0030F1DAA3
MENTAKPLTAVSSRDSGMSRSLIAGIVTGQVAGLIMAVVVMIVFVVFLGKSPLYPVQVIGSVLFGESALQGFHFGALLAGLLLHQLGPSLLWGVLYGVVASKLQPHSKGAALMLGLGISVVSMAGPYILIPLVMNLMQGVDYWNREVPMFWDWAAHVVFGASFALYPMIEKKLQKN